jgi:hypothetical protein
MVTGLTVNGDDRRPVAVAIPFQDPIARGIARLEVSNPVTIYCP